MNTKPQEITDKQIRNFVSFLRGDLRDDGVKIHHMPELNDEQSMSILWYLQEVLPVIPDHYECCSRCGVVIDTDAEGTYLDPSEREEHIVTHEWFADLADQHWHKWYCDHCYFAVLGD